MKITRRISTVVAAILTCVALLFVTSGSANATVGTLHTTNQWYGFNYSHADCDLVYLGDFYYQGFRSSSTTLQFRFQVAYTGHMTIQIDAPGSESHTWYVTGNPDNFKAPIYWVTWNARLGYYFYMNYRPDSGGACAVYFHAPPL